MPDTPLRILITGATSFIGNALAPHLLALGHEVIYCVRNEALFKENHPHILPSDIWEVDFSQPVDIEQVPRKIDVAYYLMHSMSGAIGTYARQDRLLVQHFLQYLEQTSCQQIIYLGGIANSPKLSKHLASRLEVEQMLHDGAIPATALRAAVVVGRGGSSFNILKEICEKAPVLMAPKWIQTACQPIFLEDALRYLSGVLLHPTCLNQSFDIGGSDVLSYQEMLVQLAQEMGRKLPVMVFPFYTPPLWSAGWSVLLQSAPLSLTVNLLESMEYEAICQQNNLAPLLNISPIGYREAVRRTLVSG